MRTKLFYAWRSAINVVLCLPGYRLRHWLLRSICRFDLAPDASVQRRLRLSTRGCVSIGSRSIVNAGVYLDGRGSIDIGADVSISPGVQVLTAGHIVESETFEGSVNGVVIADRAWIGSHALILPGVTVGEGAVIGAGSVVSRDVEPWTIVRGNPAEPCGKRPSIAQRRLVDHRPFLQ